MSVQYLQTRITSQSPVAIQSYSKFSGPIPILFACGPDRKSYLIHSTHHSSREQIFRRATW